MSREKFPVVVTGIVTHRGEVLIGKKEEKEGHPISGEWHFPGGHVDEKEELEEAVVREIKEETGLEVDVHQLVDTQYEENGDLVRVFYHCESDSRDAEAEDDLQEVKWVDPENLEEELDGNHEKEVVSSRDRISNFIEKLQQMPVF